jgi:hypothetical protein
MVAPLQKATCSSTQCAAREACLRCSQATAVVNLRVEAGDSISSDTQRWYVIHDRVVTSWQADTTYPFPNLVLGGVGWVVGPRKPQCSLNHPNILHTEGPAVRHQLHKKWLKNVLTQLGYNRRTLRQKKISESANTRRTESANTRRTVVWGGSSVKTVLIHLFINFIQFYTL